MIPRLFAALTAVLGLPALAGAVSCTLVWTYDVTAPIDGFRLHRGMQSRQYTTVTPVALPVPRTADTTYTTTCQPGEYLSVTATKAGQLESDYSNEVFLATLPTPGNLRVILQLTLP